MWFRCVPETLTGKPAVDKSASSGDMVMCQLVLLASILFFHFIAIMKQAKPKSCGICKCMHTQITRFYVCLTSLTDSLLAFLLSSQLLQLVYTTRCCNIISGHCHIRTCFLEYFPIALSFDMCYFLVKILYILFSGEHG